MLGRSLGAMPWASGPSRRWDLAGLSRSPQQQWPPRPPSSLLWLLRRPALLLGREPASLVLEPPGGCGGARGWFSPSGPDPPPTEAEAQPDSGGLCSSSGLRGIVPLSFFGSSSLFVPFGENLFLLVHGCVDKRVLAYFCR